MSDRTQHTAANAFTAYFLAFQGHPEEADALRRAGELLMRMREPESLPLEEEGQRPDRLAAVLVQCAAAAEEARGLAEFVGAEESFIEDLLADGEPDVAFVYAAMESQTVRLAAVAEALEAAERATPDEVLHWKAARQKPAGDPFESARELLLTMARTLRSWAPEVLRRWAAMVPYLPDAAGMRRMAEENQETPEVDLYLSRDTLLGDVLAEAITELERLASVEPGPTDPYPDRSSQVHGEINPEFDRWFRARKTR